MNSATVAVIDSGANYASVAGALRRAGARVELVRDPDRLARAERAILPGVGHAGEALSRLQHNGLADVVREFTRPLLGICVGMQLLYEYSEEAGRDGFGLFPGSVTKLVGSDALRVPHCGWNRLSLGQPSPLTHGLDEGTGAWVYFVHSYAAPANAATVATCEHGQAFAAVASRDNFHGVQFHPERSAAVGRRLIENFLSL